MMRDIVDDAVEAQPDMQLVGHYADAELDVAVERHEANVVILNEATTLGLDLHTRLLCAHPGLKVVVMTGDGVAANLFEIRHLYLADPSPIALIGAIRSALERENT
jgi:DNA-binding NarL/FixJ family response regulator